MENIEKRDPRLGMLIILAVVAAELAGLWWWLV